MVFYLSCRFERQPATVVSHERKSHIDNCIEEEREINIEEKSKKRKVIGKEA